MDDPPPGRTTETAESRQRWGWSGHGEGAKVEKDAVGLFLDDVAYAFADISVSALPAILAVYMLGDIRPFGARTATLVAWLTMVVVAAVIRGGWVTPLGSDVPGWVTLAPSLVLLRFLYFNAALALAGYGGAAISGELALPLESVGFAFVVGVLSAALFPRLAEDVSRRLADS
ncbi:hypothetical protein [Haloprofundus sp. MHR1]|uniref:hypothetical protein n=1 Tax=Haloprofundus sp. MHR1 TaxID=2572921 RepID=UPI0010BF486B|nr:hypothetical protein [Haloprofundus sp. MHR1]QCJ46516.1 hypothetical protein FCF25_05035 [Haloprofundus sp. MHR1]